MILDQILAETRRTVAEAKTRWPIAVLEKDVASAPTPRGFARALRRDQTIAVISEVKRRSPSAGWIRQDADAGDVAKSYAAGGASAISVLTDTPFFGGTLDDLRKVRNAVQLPILRKDFMVDPYQVVEARAGGADAVLLIAAALTDHLMASLFREATDLGLDVLVEIHDEAELDRALALGANLIGINHRDLRTFTMDMDLAVRLRTRISSDRVVVAESGIRTVEDVGRMRRAGVDAILVGENLMRAPDPGAALAAMLVGT